MTISIALWYNIVRDKQETTSISDETTKQSEHSEALVELPKPEFYVVYSGDADIPDIISLNDTYFGGTAPVDLKIKVLDKVDKTIYGQYIGFCKIYNEQRKMHGKNIDCAKETIRICREKGYL